MKRHLLFWLGVLALLAASPAYARNLFVSSHSAPNIQVYYSHTFPLSYNIRRDWRWQRPPSHIDVRHGSHVHHYYNCTDPSHYHGIQYFYPSWYP